MKWKSVVLLAILGLGTSLASAADLPPEGVSQILALVAEKATRTPAQQRMDSQLLQAVRESRGLPMAAGVSLQRIPVESDSDGRVLLDVNVASADRLDAVLETLVGLGADVIFPSWEYRTARIRANLSDAETIAGFADVTFVQFAVGSIKSGTGAAERSALPTKKPRSALLAAQRATLLRGLLTRLLASGRVPLTGTVDSQGDRTHRADDTRNTYGYAGQGVRIGVLSDSFDALGAAAADVASGNLPGPGNPLGNTTPVTVVQDLAVGTDEGRAMLQIVHDLAPKAQLFFATADASEAAFAANILALRGAPYNCDIIIDDVFYFDEPVFQDGIVAQAVASVTASGAWYFSSAGNEGSVAKTTSGYFEGDFNDSGSPAFTFPGGAKAGTIHNFGTVATPVNGDIVLVAGQRYTLNWSDPVNASANDYDLFLVSSAGTVKASSTNIQSGTQLAFEQIVPLALAAGDRLVVFKTGAAAVRAFSLNTIRGRLTVVTTGQTHGHSAVVAAFSVAATPAVGPFPAAFSGANLAETFTSDGPRRVFYAADGTPITPGNFLFGTNGGTVRAKPDITAADGVSTTLSPTSGLNPFFGTSAAAPHAGAIAALLKSANSALTPAQLRTILTTTAVDIEDSGPDTLTGFGIVQAFQAMQAVSPTPLATLNLGTVTPSEGAFSNGNGKIDPGETANLTIQLTDFSTVVATAVSGTLVANTAGVTVTQGTASWGTIGGGTSKTNATPFQFGIDTSVACGTSLSFTLTVTFGGGVSPATFLVNVPVGFIPGASLSSTLGSAPPTGPGFTSTSGTQTGRITRTGVESTCAAPKANPGLTVATGARQFDAYTLTNTNSSSQCVTVSLTSTNGVNLYTAAYDGAGFVPANPSTNYLADPGASSNNQTYSFTAPAGLSFTVVVHEINPGGSIGSAYTLSVSLAECAAGPACTPVTISTGSIASGATGAPYTQGFAATGGSGSYTFTLSGALPAGLSFSGNTLSGTPTQAGSFPISITPHDVAGCPGASKPFTLVISGNAAASITPSAGTPQSTLPLTAFPTALRALVRDGAAAPLPGVNVTFTAPAAGASGTFPGALTSATVVTDASGIATAPTFTANGTLGGYVVSATVVGVASPANFNLTNACTGPFVVTSSADSGANTLRAHVANACPGITITFAPAVTLITLASEIPIAKAVTISGPGPSALTISGNNAVRIFNVNAGANAVTISGVTLRDGKPTGGSTGGGAILVNNGASIGAVNLSNSVLTNNDASSAGNPLGGGIDNEGGTVTIDRCSIVNNTATFRGGGIQNQGFGSMVITNSTIAGNTAGTAGIGGGIRSLLNLTLTNVTIFGNSAQTAGNVSRSGGTITFGNTIIAGGTLLGGGGTGPDVSGAGFNSVDYNLIQDTSTATITGTTTHNITGTSPLLGSLGNHGGGLPTLVPGTASPVIDHGDPAMVGSDQRGFPRAVGAAPDMGAVETHYVLASTSGTPQAAVVGTAFTSALIAFLTESGAPAPAGQDVTFTAPGAGASGTFPGSVPSATVQTDATGHTAAPTFTANLTAGAYALNANVSVPSVAAATFNLSNVLTLIDLKIVKTHAASFTQGQANAAYTLSVSNVGNASTNGSTVIVSDVLPAGLAFASATGSGWLFGFAAGTFTATRSNVLLPASAYPTITLTVSVASNAPALITNTATVSGGGDANPANNSSSDATPIAPRGRFDVVTPCRAFDSRSSAPIAAGGTITVTLTGGACGIPSDATAVSVNVTVTQPAAPGFVSLYAGDQPPPPTSTLNFSGGQTRANNAIVSLATDGSGKIKITNGAAGAIQVIIDVNGSFK